MSNINNRNNNNKTTTPKAIISMALRGLNGVENAIKKAGYETQRANLRSSDSRWASVVGTNHSYMRQVPELTVKGADGEYIINLALRTREEVSGIRTELSLFCGFAGDPTKYCTQRVLLDQGEWLILSNWCQPQLSAAEIHELQRFAEEQIWSPLIEAIGEIKWERGPKGQLVYHI